MIKYTLFSSVFRIWRKRGLDSALNLLKKYLKNVFILSAHYVWFRNLATIRCTLNCYVNRVVREKHLKVFGYWSQQNSSLVFNCQFHKLQQLKQLHFFIFRDYVSLHIGGLHEICRKKSCKLNSKYYWKIFQEV